MTTNIWCRIGALALVSSLIAAACARPPQARPGEVLDEARSAARAVSTFPAADEDYFREMDQNNKGVAALAPEEVKGRNTWIVWTGGNDRFWDAISVKSAGVLDFLKTVSSYDPDRDPRLSPDKKARIKDNYKFNRGNRWHYLGLVNEPCFEKATGPDPERFGLWLDKRRADCPPDPFENEKKYPGVKIGARGRNLPVGSYYGYASGMVGLRLFPNPDFDEAAAKKWDPVRYYNDPDYYNSKDLIRPFRVGMSCAFCHVGPNPIKPPSDPENPQWENLSSNVGAQYFWVDRIFVWEADPTSFVYQLFHTSRPGALDTSLVSTDNINNPRTMNAVYSLGTRLEHAKRWGKETLADGSLNNKQFNAYVPNDHWLAQFFEPPDTVWTPRVLKDGADSVGGLGALNRVYLNIGLFSEEWLLHFNALIGGTPMTPIEIKLARQNSAYWEATEAQTPDMALFFLKTATPHKLADAPGGRAFLPKDPAQLTRGKEVFGERCARCHSSKIPKPAVGVDPAGCTGAGYLDCWKRYWEWTKTDEFKKQMRQIAMANDFLDNNFLSTELRVPVTLLETNACSPLATNGIRDNIWDNFSSQSYKDLPSVGEITVYHPVTGAPLRYKMPAGGRGYTRPASLISLWSTAPFLLNNTVGTFNPSPSVEARMQSFQDSIEKMLWPEKRDQDLLLGDKVPGRMDRTTTTTYLRVARGYLPDELQKLSGPLDRWFPRIFRDGGVQIGPIPAGTPINLLANLSVLSDSSDPAERLKHDKKVVDLLLKAKDDLKSLPENVGDEQARKVFADLVDPLFELSKCPDFIVNRGHYFGTSMFKEEPGLSDGDKRALIEFLKTF
jgi:hypothetical protein